jgi:hypothetical protein
MEAELQLIAEPHEQPLRVALHALPLVMVVRHDEVLDDGCVCRELLRSLTDPPRIPGAHDVVLPVASTEPASLRLTEPRPLSARDLREVAETAEPVPQVEQQAQAIAAKTIVVRHHHDVVEEARH